MLFQALDKKENCVGVYVGDKIFFGKIPKKISKKLSKTWDYADHFQDKDIEYAKIYCHGKSLDEVCPMLLRQEWEQIYGKLKAFHRAMREAKLSLDDHCFYELVPEAVLIDFCKIKNKICNYIFDVYEKPKNYASLVELTKILAEMKSKKLDIDFSALNKELYKSKTRKFIKNIKMIKPYVDYNLYKTKTGRLVSRANSFPILTMDKSYRKILKPNNDWFLEFDYNAAELRVMLGLLGKEQPQEDLHEWNLKNVYRGAGTRDEAKKRIFAWLYNPESKDCLSNQEYNREELLTKYWNGTHINTYFNREIEADKHHALNYIIQSTAADLFFQQMIKVRKLLEGGKSYIAFCLHDSLIIDFSDEDKDRIMEIKNIFEETDLGKFVATTKAGKNFGEMKKLHI